VSIGQGFTIEESAALQGYVEEQSVEPGDVVRVAVSTTFDSYEVRIRRLVPASAVVRRIATVSTGSGPSILPPGYRSGGCGWPVALSAMVTDSWISGVYDAELTGPQGLRQHAVFVVRPSAPTADLLVVIPTYTYNAYNHWGGHDQYSDGQSGVRRVLSFHRPSTSAEVEATGAMSHLLQSDLVLLRWLAGEDVAFDCVADSDVHGRGADLLRAYRAVLLCTHPEYISDAMRDAFAGYLRGGGRLIYTGGNGFYERTVPTPDGSALTLRRRDGSRDIYGHDGRPESELLGVDFAPDGFLSFSGYQVTDPGHPFLAGIGVAAGDVFGVTSANVAASGWETDRVPPDGPASVFAEGEHPFGAQMCRLAHRGGGWTFAGASLGFNGALDQDPVVSGILRNVIAAATAP
jgi:hypothetical protein